MMQIVVIYVFFGTLWILTSDRLLAVLVPNTAVLSIWQSAKGGCFVLVTALLLHSLLRRCLRKVQLAQWLSSQTINEYRLLFDKNPNPMWVFDTETLGFLAVNEAAIAHYGYSKGEFLGMTLLDMRPAEDVPVLLDAMAAKPMESSYRGHWRHQKRNGSVIEVEIAANRLTFAGRSAGIALITDVTEQRQAETAVRQSEARMRRVLENMPVLLDAFDETGGVLVWNEECERVTGYSAEEIVGNPNAMDLLYPDLSYRQQMIKQWSERGNNYRSWEWDLISKDGTAKTIAWSNVSEIFPVPGWASWGIGVDVSDRNQAYEAIRRREHYFKSLTENSSDIVVVLDAEGKFLYCTPSSERVLGYTLADVVGRSAMEFVPPEDVPIILATLASAIHTPRVSVPLVKYRVRHQDGSLRVFEAVTTSLLEDPIVQGVIVNCRDVTDRDITEAALRQSEARFQRMAANVPGVIYRYVQQADGSDSITYINSACRELYELEPEAIEQDVQLMWALIHPEDLAYLSQSIAVSAETLEPWQWEWRITTPSGCLKWIQGVARPERQPNGDTVWDGLLVDISDRKRNETERKRVAEAWRQSEERFRSLSLCAPIGIYMADSEGNGTWANPRLGAIAGCASDKLLGAGWAQLIHPQDQQQAIERWQIYHQSIRLRSQRCHPFIHEYRLQRRDGSVRWVRSTSAPMFDDAGTLLGRVKAVEDITNRKQAEDDIRNRNRELQALYSISAIALQTEAIGTGLQQIAEEISTTTNFPIVAIELYDATAQVMRFEGTVGLPHSSDRSPLEVPVEQTLSGTVVRTRQSVVKHYVPGEAKAYDSNEMLNQLEINTFICVPLISSRNAFGTLSLAHPEVIQTDENLVRLVESLANYLALIIDRKLSEQAIQTLNTTLEAQNHNLEALVQQRTAELYTLINALPDFIFVIENPTMRILFSNQAHSQMYFGLPPEAVQGKTIFECFPAEQAAEYAEQNQSVFESGEVLHFQQTDTTSTSTLHFDIYKIPLKRPNGDVYALIGASRNVTDLVEARQALIVRTTQLEVTNRELDSFSYSVSHDLRAPLRHINGFLKALRDELERCGAVSPATVDDAASINPTASRYLQIIAESSKKMGLLIDGLLMLSRMGRRQMQTSEVDLNALVKTAIDFASHNPVVVASTEFRVDPLPTVAGDATLLQQVLSNLIENALKFSRDRHPACIEIGSLPDGTIFVRDNGVGFDMRYVDQLFGAFQRLHSQREFEGTGIGLAIVQRIIHRHNGTIWAESQPNQGATFYFTLNANATEHELVG